MELIKNEVKGSAIYYYHLLHPEDEFINNMMNQSISVDASLVRGDSNKRKYILSITRCHCYRNIIKNNRIDIVNDVIQNMRRREMESLARATIEENNKEVLELLYKNNLDTHFYVRQDNKAELFHIFAYEKRGSEIIKCMKDIGFDICHNITLINYVFSKNDKNTINYIVDNTETVEQLFLDCILRCAYNNTKFIVEYFMEKIDVCKYKENIFAAFGGSSVDDVKWFLQYATFDSNSLLLSACECRNIELIEFYLQYGLQVDGEILGKTFGISKQIMNLFIKYDVDFSLLKFTDVDYDFVRSLERNGFDIHAWVYTRIK